MHRSCAVALALFVSLTLLSAREMYSQETSSATKVGLSASLQTTQFDIMLPILIGNSFSIAPAFGLIWADGEGSDLHLGLVPRFFFHKNKVAPYIGGKIGVLIASPHSGQSATDVITGLALGGEYFVDEYFSVGVESQVNVTISSEKSTRFGNPGKANLNTAAALFATVYF